MKIKVTNPDLLVANKNTGEILEANKTFTVQSVDEFIMIFLKTIPEMFSLTGSEIKVLMFCWKHSTFNLLAPEANKIVNNVVFKQALRAALNISDAAVDNNIYLLCKKGFLIKECKGQYQLNPEYFFKGKLTDRAKLSININYEPSNDF